MTIQKSSSNYWTKCISTEGNIRGVAIQASELVQVIAECHHLKGQSVRGLGEAVIGALLIASYCKPGERVNLNIQGSGYYQQALVDAYPEGIVRGYVMERELYSPSGDSIGPWGTGFLSVLRTKDEEGMKPYIGTVPLLTGHLAKDLSFYWVQSEQIPSAVGLNVHCNEGQVVSAEGFLVQALPGASLAELKAMERHIFEIQTSEKGFGQGVEPLGLLSSIFQNTAFIVLEEKALQFKCNCSWQRVERALNLIGAEELHSMLATEEEAIVRCDFCAKEYMVGNKILKRLIEESKTST